MELTSHLVDKFQEIKIEFRKVLMGVTSERSRWSQCVEWTNKKLGMALGTLFIRDNFDNVAKVGSIPFPFFCYCMTGSNSVSVSEFHYSDRISRQKSNCPVVLRIVMSEKSL